jgi:CheY-like chemotaxis protein
MNNVLVVDNDQTMLRTLTGCLRGQGGLLNFIPAANKVEARELLRQNRIDLVITAIRGTLSDGFGLLKELTAEYPAIKLIVMTSNLNPLLRARLKRYPSAVLLDQNRDMSMLSRRIFTELMIDYGGHVRGINLSSFLQMIELESLTCTLKISAKSKNGILWLQHGELIAAQAELTTGQEAALEIISWNNVVIDIDYTPRDIERQISIPLMMLILESGQRDDEKQSSTTNSRAYERHDLVVALDYDIKNNIHHCTLKDISLGGAYIETDQPLDPTQNIRITLTSHAMKSSCSVDATVVRTDSKGTGIRFLPQNPFQRQMIQSIISGSLRTHYTQNFDQEKPASAVHPPK